MFTSIINTAEGLTILSASHLYTVFYPAGLYHRTCVYEVRSILKNVCRLTRSAPPGWLQVVIMMVNGNLGAGVAVLGAFSLVRFRSTPGSAKEICASFLRWRSALRQEWAMSPLRQR